MYLIRTIIPLVAAMFAPICVRAEPCLHYMGEPVSLAGRLELQSYFGPPGYGETPDTDRRETQAILDLPQSICVDANPADGDPGEANQHKVTLVPLHGENLELFKGEAVAVTGILFHAITGHHHTAVLLELADVRLSSAAKANVEGIDEAGGLVAHVQIEIVNDTQTDLTVESAVNGSEVEVGPSESREAIFRQPQWLRFGQEAYEYDIEPLLNLSRQSKRKIILKAGKDAALYAWPPGSNAATVEPPAQPKGFPLKPSKKVDLTEGSKAPGKASS